MAVVTPTHIIVGNVGDSRCILVQNSFSELSLPEAVETKMKLEEENELVSEEEIRAVKDSKEKMTKSQPQARLLETKNKTETGRSTIIKPLSDNHKPNLPGEQLRIENMGLKVIEERFLTTSDGQKKTQ